MIKAISDLIQNNWLMLLLLFVVWLLIWLIIREIRTWYWKINDILVLLKKIETNTNQSQSALNVSEDKATTESGSKMN